MRRHIPLRRSYDSTPDNSKESPAACPCCSCRAGRTTARRWAMAMQSRWSQR